MLHVKSHKNDASLVETWCQQDIVPICEGYLKDEKRLVSLASE
jgi:hypothetical protein